MIDYPVIDPVAIALGPLQVHWYGLMYLVGFGTAWWLGKLRARQAHTVVEEKHVDDMIFFGAIGVVLGGRIGSVLFYNFDTFLQDPSYLLRVWQGGMSFHGGFIGVLLVIEWYRRRIGCSFFELADFVAPLIPIGIAAGRLGNFINAELWGAPATAPWAMKLSCEVFPPDRYVDFAGPLCYAARHPSQLYEMMLEGVLLFAVLWWVSRKPQPVMLVSGLFVLLYGLGRSAVEFVRLPDAHIGYLMGTEWLTRGIVLSLPMIILGVVLIYLAKRQS